MALAPPDGARFLSWQRFDIRVEGQGTGPFSATLALDGVPVAEVGPDGDDSVTNPVSAAPTGPGRWWRSR